MTRRLAAAAVAAAVITALTGIAATAAAPVGAGRAAAAHARTRVLRDCVHAKREPVRIIVTCADGNIQAIRLHWRRWGPISATGHGYMRINNCKPSCAGGKFRNYAARVTLTVPRKSRVGRLFSKLTATFTRRPYRHHHRVTWTLPTKPI